jgi:uncharacterized protein with PIN domain
MQMLKQLECLSCDGVLSLVSSESFDDQKYDYKETTHYYYYKCDECEKMFDERIKSSGLRHLSMANRKKAEKLAIQTLN